MSAEVLGQIQALLSSLPRDEKLHLINLLAKQVQEEPPPKRISLEGKWEGKFPPDFDIDAALKEIRGEWLEELEWVGRIERGEENPGDCP